MRQCFIDQGVTRSYINRQINRIKRVFKWGCPRTDRTFRLSRFAGRRGLEAGALPRPGGPARLTAVPDIHMDAIEPYVSRQV